MSKQSRLILGVLIAGLATILAISLYPSSTVIKLPNSSMLQLVEVVGTNDFVAGSAVEKLLQSWIPPQGVRIFGIPLERPGTNTVALRDGSTLNLWFSSIQTAAPITSVPDMRRLRFVAFSEDGQSYVNDVELRITTSTNHPFFVAALTSFPRDQERIGVRVLWRTNQTEWSRAAEFFVENPLVPDQNRDNWIAEPIPRTNEIDGITVVFGGCDIGTHGTKENEPPLYAQAKFQFLTNGIPTANMTLSRATIWDSLGNFQRMETWPWQTQKEGWFIKTTPAVRLNDVWKLQARVVRRRTYPLDELVSFKDLPYDKAVVITNKAAVAITIARLTDSAYVKIPTQGQHWLSVGNIEADGSFRRFGGHLSPQEAMFDSTQLTPGQQPAIALDETIYIEYKFKPSLIENPRATRPSSSP